MKTRLLLSLSILALGVILVGCSEKENSPPLVDYVSVNYYAWSNDSNREITFSVNRIFMLGYANFRVVLRPGEKHEEKVAGNNPMELVPPSPGWCETATVCFDKKYSVEFGWLRHIDEAGYYDFSLSPMDYDIRYNPTVEANFERKEVISSEICPECAGARWTYTFTNADYDAAVKYAEATQAQVTLR